MKKMMKLCAVLLLTICMASVFVACGDSDNGGELPGSDIYVLQVNGEFVKGEAIELGKGNKCLIWSDGGNEAFTYKISGMLITLGNGNGRLITGTKAGNSLMLTMDWETRVYVKYSGKDWRIYDEE